MSALRFEPLREEHLDEIMTIEPEAYPQPWSIGMFREEIRNHLSYFYAVYAGGALVGYCGFWLVLDEAHITSVTVRAGRRRQGLGRQMVVYLLTLAQKLGARRAMLEVRERNTAAQQLYTNLGFTQVGLRKGYYASTNEDALIMLRGLQNTPLPENAP